jgi:dCMP deaminase
MNWNDYFMGLAQAAATKSKDPSTRVGAVIVDMNRRIVSIGYNGPPRGTNDNYAYSTREVKMRRVLHAEENAMLFAGRTLRGCAIYCTHHPCAHCAALICQVGIVEVYHPPLDEGFAERWAADIAEARSMFVELGVQRIPVMV